MKFLALDCKQCASKAGALGVQDFVVAGTCGKFPGNVHRDMLSTLSRRSAWPPLYWADVRTTNGLKSHPFILPHEWLAAMVRMHGRDSDVFGRNVKAWGSNVLEHLEATCKELHIDVATCEPLGLHGDGVPFGSRVWTDDSLECLNLNFPGFQQRIPVTVMQKTIVIKHETFHDIMNVLKWSLQICATGVFPSVRHDGSPFGRKESHRAAKSNTPMGCKALLCEIRGDWAFYKQTFDFPQWNEKSGICWCCKATPDTYKDCTETAEWKQPAGRLSPDEFHQKLLEGGNQPSPLFSAPGVSAKINVQDWLHCADIGIASDFLGNVLLALVDCKVGGTRESRTADLWQIVKHKYAVMNVSDRLEKLVPASFLREKQSPKLKCKGAIVRHFVPVANEIVQEQFVNGTLLQQTIAAAMLQLHLCYACLEVFDAAALKKASNKFGLLVVAIEAHVQQLNPGTKRWTVKPKLHLFLEMTNFVIQHKGNPRLFWCYRDETFGGCVRDMAERRGGKNSAAATASSLLNKYRCTTALPSWPCRSETEQSV